MKRMWYIIRQTAYTLFAFAFFLGMAVVLTVWGVILLTIGGHTDDHKMRYHRTVQRMTHFVVNHIPGTSFSFLNPTKEAFSQPSVIICNHQSHLDLMAVMMIAPNIIILTKHWVWHNPFYGAIIRYLDYLPTGDTEQTFTRIEAMVKRGYSVMIFPEGTRSEDCHIQRFHRGAFFLAERLHLDIIPLYIKGFGKVLPKHSRHLHPGHLSLEVLPRITASDARWSGDYRTMTKVVHQLYVEKSHE